MPLLILVASLVVVVLIMRRPLRLVDPLCTLSQSRTDVAQGPFGDPS